MQQIRVTGGSRQVNTALLPEAADLTSLAFFEHLNQFLRNNPRLPAEALLMTQLDQVRIGPGVDFAAEALPPGLQRRADGAVVVRLQRDPPSEPDVNWLPVNEGPLFVTLRFFEPEPAVLSGAYEPPPVVALP